MQKIYSRQFKNGLRFFAIPRPSSTSATFFVMYQVGSRYETSEIAGISHFLEHMMFKGTKKRPTQREISRELDSLGAEYNAMTSKDWTGYYVKTADELIEKGIDVYADSLLHSKFAPDAIKRERTVIVEEIKMYLDNPLFHIGDMFEQLLYGDTNIGREIAGSPKTVMATTQAKIRDYYERYYQPQNAVVAVSGNINVKKLEKKIEKLFGGMTSKERDPYPTCTLRQTKPRVQIMKKNTEQTQLELGFIGLDYQDPRLPALEVLSVILGNGMSSRLFEVIREQLGLAYSVRSQVGSYEDTGSFSVRAGVDPKSGVKAVKAILKELSRVKRTLVTSEELRRAKRFLIGSLALELEQSDSYAMWVAKQSLFKKKVETVQQIEAKIGAVTRQQLRAIAKELFTKDRLNLAIIGPHKAGSEFERALATFR